MPEINTSSVDTAARVVDKRKNWEARVEMAIFKRPSSELSTYDKLVYAILCGHANRDGNAMLYVKTIAEEASCSERQTRRALSNLEARRLLVRRPQSAAGQGQTFNVYEIYGHDAYLSGALIETGGDESSCQTVTPPLTVSQAPYDSQAELNNVFEQPLKNSLKDNNIPPTPRGVGEGGGDSQTSKKPQSQSLKHDTGLKDGSAEPADTTGSPTESIHAAVMAAYNEILPELPRAEALTASRSQTLNLRIHEDLARQEPDWWKRYFERVRLFPWLMGNNPSNWRASFDWLTSEDGMRKVIEGSFSQAPRQSQDASAEKFQELQNRYTDERGFVNAKALLREWKARPARS